MKKRVRFLAGAVIMTLVLTMIPTSVIRGESAANTQGTNVTNDWSSGGYGSKGCLTGNIFYYNIYNKLYKLNIKTGVKKLVKAFDCFSISSIHYYNSKLILVIDKYNGTGGAFPNIVRTELDGSKEKFLDYGDSVSLNKGIIYYMKLDGSVGMDSSESWDAIGVSSMTTSGTKKKALIVSDLVEKVICDGKNLYYSTVSGSYQTTLAGKKVVKVLGKETLLLGVYKKEVYYDKFDFKKQTGIIYKKNLATKKSSVVLKSNMEGTAKLDAVTGKLYYILGKASGSKDSIYQLNLKTKATKVVMSQKDLGTIMIYGKYVLYTYYDGIKYTISKFWNTTTKKRIHIGTYYCS